MKRTTVWFMIVLILICGQPAFAQSQSDDARDAVSPTRYSYTDDITASLSISSSGTATCKGKLVASDSEHKCEITVSLKKKDSDGKWSILVASWSGSGSGDSGASVSKTKSGLTAGSYKAFVKGKIKNANGVVLEKPSVESKERQYPA